MKLVGKGNDMKFKETCAFCGEILGAATDEMLAEVMIAHYEFVPACGKKNKAREADAIANAGGPLTKLCAKFSRRRSPVATSATAALPENIVNNPTKGGNQEETEAAGAAVPAVG